MAIRYGGETPQGYGLQQTFEAVDGTSSTTPVEVGDMFIIGGTDADGSGYKLADGSSADDNATPKVLVQATERATSVRAIGCFVLGPYQQIRRIPYKSGSAPTVGQSIELSSDLRTVVGKTFDGWTMVLLVDTVNLEVEVLC